MPAAIERKVDDLGAIGAQLEHRLSFSFGPAAVDWLELPARPPVEIGRVRTAEPCARPASHSARPLRAKWFWYSVVSLLCWTAWALTAKVGSSAIPPSEMQFISGLGFLLVSIMVALVAKGGSSTSRKGRLYSVISGVLLAIGGLASFAAYRLGANIAATTGITSLYPGVTVVCALVVLKERLTKWQIAGLCFSGLAIFLFSF